MSSLSKAVCLCALAALNAHPSVKPKHFPLPAAAVVTLGATGHDSSAEAAFCVSTLGYNAKKVRAMFSSYHLLQPGELHDRYDLAPCWQDGTVSVAGKVYTFRINPLHTLATDFPDGQQKTLGGAASGDLSGR